MKSQTNWCGTLLILEVVAAYTFPVFVLALGTIFSFIAFAALFSQAEMWGLAWIAIVAGGYLGMLGVIRLTIDAIKRHENISLRAFVYTGVGCLSVMPLIIWAVGSNNVWFIVASFAPLIVAMQLTLMNRRALQKALGA
ncbi:MAG: hypothetical protein GJ680_06775 [Alteromonadaceae bacterium]|nr:hypothetical protein [Alteromonadaceae bacterium]